MEERQIQRKFARNKFALVVYFLRAHRTQLQRLGEDERSFLIQQIRIPKMTAKAPLITIISPNAWFIRKSGDNTLRTAKLKMWGMAYKQQNRLCRLNLRSNEGTIRIYVKSLYVSADSTLFERLAGALSSCLRSSSHMTTCQATYIPAVSSFIT
jgi:hypothetical protein